MLTTALQPYNGIADLVRTETGFTIGNFSSVVYHRELQLQHCKNKPANHGRIHSEQRKQQLHTSVMYLHSIHM
jgi:hypothetical protein